LSQTASAPDAPPLLRSLVQQLRPALVGFVALTVITGGLYPALVYVIGQAAFPDQANGGLLSRGGVVVGSRLIGQPFARQATCASADEACDLQFVVGPMDAPALADTLRRTARLVRDDGLLIVQLAGPAEEAAIRPALAAAGFETQFSLIDRSAGRLVMHRLRRADWMRKTG
jgi:hypothetical protein